MAGRRWTEEEEIFLSCNVGRLNVSALAKSLNRTEDAILTRMQRIGCDHTKSLTGQLTLNELGKLLKVDGHVVNRWVKNFGLKAIKRSTRTTAKFSFISAERFWEWAEQHKNLINFSKIEPNTIIPEPDWVEIERKRDFKEIPTMNRSRWTAKMDEQLIWLYKMEFSKSEIGLKMGRSERAIVRRLSRLKKQGILPFENIKIPWTDQELEILYTMKKQGATAVQIAYQLGREPAHVQDKLRRLKNA